MSEFHTFLGSGDQCSNTVNIYIVCSKDISNSFVFDYIQKPFHGCVRVAEGPQNGCHLDGFTDGSTFGNTNSHFLSFFPLCFILGWRNIFASTPWSLLDMFKPTLNKNKKSFSCNLISRDYYMVYCYASCIYPGP